MQVSDQSDGAAQLAHEGAHQGHPGRDVRVVGGGRGGPDHQGRGDERGPRRDGGQTAWTGHRCSSGSPRDDGVARTGVSARDASCVNALHGDAERKNLRFLYPLPRSGGAEQRGLEGVGATLRPRAGPHRRARAGPPRAVRALGEQRREPLRRRHAGPLARAARPRPARGCGRPSRGPSAGPAAARRRGRRAPARVIAVPWPPWPTTTLARGISSACGTNRCTSTPRAPQRAGSTCGPVVTTTRAGRPAHPSRASWSRSAIPA